MTMYASYIGRESSTASPRISLFCHNVDEELRTVTLVCINQSTVKLVSYTVASLQVAEPIDGVR